jgi:hypothetical protein
MQRGRGVLPLYEFKTSRLKVFSSAKIGSTLSFNLEVLHPEL